MPGKCSAKPALGRAGAESFTRLMESLSSVEKAFKILTLFSAFRPSIDVNEISRDLGIPKSTVYRLIRIMMKYELLEQDNETHGYRLGIRIFQMGNIVKYQRRVGEIAYPFLVELRNITKETVILVVVEGHKSLVLREVEGIHVVRLTHDEGRTMPLHAGASSRILLAYLSTEEQDEIIQEGLPRFTENTITDAIELKKELAKIRENGYAFSDQELDEGARAISAPIRNFSGKVIAGISLVGPVQRFNDANIEKCVPLVKEYGAKISKMLGFGSG